MSIHLKKFVRRTLLPFALMLLCPPTVILVWYTNVFLHGSLMQLWDKIQHEGLFLTLKTVWGPIFFGTPTAWIVIGVFALIQVLFMRFLPGKRITGPVTPKGNVPIYKANGVFAFALTLLLYYVSAYLFHFFPATLVYDHFGAILSALNIFSLGFCLMLYFKGRFAPSSSDSGISGNFLFDFFWGTELYPRLANIDVKMFTNCRFGMMGWGLIILSFAAKQQQLHGLSNSMVISVALQLIYIAKFFIWEPGYMRSMDIMNDRAGYMICWGCLVWVPGVYTSASLYLVNHPHHLKAGIAFLIFAFGLLGILINYFADRQRQRVRLTDGKCLIWKKIPFLISVSYTTDSKEVKHSTLLASGWWGLARHFHYIPELIAALCWTLPALFIHVLPYFYFFFLLILLVDRAARHERRCAQKYGAQWKLYCEKVPYKWIPFIY